MTMPKRRDDAPLYPIPSTGNATLDRALHDAVNLDGWRLRNERKRSGIESARRLAVVEIGNAIVATFRDGAERQQSLCDRIAELETENQRLAGLVDKDLDARILDLEAVLGGLRERCENLQSFADGADDAVDTGYSLAIGVKALLGREDLDESIDKYEVRRLVDDMIDEAIGYEPFEE